MHTTGAKATNPTAMKRPHRKVLRSFFVGTMATIGLTVALTAPASAATYRPQIAAAAVPSAAVVVACVDFQPIADNAVLGVNFARAGYNFQSVGGVAVIVNDTVDLAGTLVHGPQFHDAGLRVALPAPADAVDVTMGVFHPAAVQIRAFDASGAVVDTAAVPADNIMHTVTLDGATDITRLRFTGGGNEAIVQEICSF